MTNNFRTFREIRQANQLERFAYNFPPPPNPEQTSQWNAINEAAKTFTVAIMEIVPCCEDRDEAVRAIRVATMMAKDALLVDANQPSPVELTPEEREEADAILWGRKPRKPQANEVRHVHTCGTLPTERHE